MWFLFRRANPRYQTEVEASLWLPDQTHMPESLTHKINKNNELYVTAVLTTQYCRNKRLKSQHESKPKKIKN